MVIYAQNEKRLSKGQHHFERGNTWWTSFDSLENRCSRKGTVGSNPTPSASQDLICNLMLQLGGSRL